MQLLKNKGVEVMDEQVCVTLIQETRNCTPSQTCDLNVPIYLT